MECMGLDNLSKAKQNFQKYHVKLVWLKFNIIIYIIILVIKILSFYIKKKRFLEKEALPYFAISSVL